MLVISSLEIQNTVFEITKDNKNLAIPIPG